nr:hypothetical protein GCM10020185_02330 [Pseudomonas brassicacearum subsp. brassicacearum]
MLGLNGYYLKQTTDDKQYGRTVQFAGQDVDDGVRGQVFAIGPALHLTFLKYASAEIRWAKEFAVENRTEGEMLWAKVSIPFAFLNGCSHTACFCHKTESPASRAGSLPQVLPSAQTQNR